MRGMDKVVFGLAAILLLSFGGFGIGFAYRHYAIWPTDDAIELVHQSKRFLRTGIWGKANQFSKADVSAYEPRAKIYKPDSFVDGYRIFLVYDSDLATYSARLINGTGEQVHVWPISYSSLMPEEAVDDPSPHGMKVLPDGSILVNFGPPGGAIMRLDSCARPIWIAAGPYHHSIELDDDGSIWTWWGRDGHQSNLQSIVRLDADKGNVLAEISLQSVFSASSDNALKLRLSQDYKFLSNDQLTGRWQTDAFHPNDVEPLSAEMARDYPAFDAGDLMISLRNLDLVAVMDPESLDIRWVAYGPWRRQHDPDFVGDGQIEVYDNNPKFGRSNVITIDTNTHEAKRLWSSETSRFYSETMGKQQRLPNGTHLVVVPDQGRALELDSNGDKVFEYQNIAAEGAVAIIMNAQWVPPDYFSAEPACAEDLAAQQ